MRRVWGVTRLRLAQLLRSLRLWMIAALMLLYMLGCYQGYRDFARIVDWPISAGVWAFFTNDQTCQITITAFAVALFANAPFRDDMHDAVIARSGRAALALGNCLYILLASCLYVALLLAFQWIACAPYMTWGNEWGGVLKSLASGQMPEGVRPSFYPTNAILYGFEPHEALAHAVALETLCVATLGLIVCLGNRLFRRPVGLWFSGALVALDITIYNLFSWRVNAVSPLSLARLGVYGEYSGIPLGGSTLYGYLFFGAAIALLTAAIVAREAAGIRLRALQRGVVTRAARRGC